MLYQSLRLLSILLALLLLTHTTASTPYTPNPITPPSLSVPNITYTPPSYKCSSKRFFKSDHRPFWSECFRAIRTLPTIADDGSFHNDGVNNGYRLPVTESFGHCRAQVEIAPHVTAVSTWITVTAALDQLSILCRRQTSKGERTGGWLLMEPERNIKVSLLGPDDSPFGVEGWVEDFDFKQSEE